MRKYIIGLALFCVAFVPVGAQSPDLTYKNLQKKLAVGWNTWNTQSILSHVLLPEGISINLGFKDNSINGDNYLHESYPSYKDKLQVDVTLGYHAYDGSYTEATLKWHGMTVKVETATRGKDLMILVTPIQLPEKDIQLVSEVAMIWNRAGIIQKKAKKIHVQVNNQSRLIQATKTPKDAYLPLKGQYLVFKLNETIGISFGKEAFNLYQIKKQVQIQRSRFEDQLKKFQPHDETYLVQQSAIAWNTIYDPEREAVIVPVSRIWNSYFGGSYVLFNWDSYLSGLMTGFDNKELAYANVVEVTKSIDRFGMVPNYVSAQNLGSPDRSQPPVGSIVVLELYKKYQDKWMVELLFDKLIRWNQWWIDHRQNKGFLAWGSDPIPPDGSANTWQGAAYESGLDNSPMYDDVPFDSTSHQLLLADVGLMSLYIADCKALSELALVLGRPVLANQLKDRADRFSQSLSSLWNNEVGMFLNKRLDSGDWSHRLSPTLFYPLIAKVATPDQVKRMIEQHLLNPMEFWGEWVLPSIARKDSSFHEQDYWRGRIWAPLNFLVYLGLRNYDFPTVRAELAQKSNDLLLKSWRSHRAIFENYHVSGEGRLPKEALNRSDNFYHWGALLGYIYLLEKGVGETR